MSAQNKALVRRGVDEVWNGKNVDAVDELLARDFIVHAATPEKEIHGREGVRQQFGMLRSAFPDLEFTIEDQIAEGDRVVTRWSATGTHTGEFQGIPPTRAQGRITGIDIDRIVDGKIVECWSQWDEVSLLQLVGAIPAPEPVG